MFQGAYLHECPDEYVLDVTFVEGGGGLVQQLRKSYSLSDLTSSGEDHRDSRSQQEMDEADDVVVTDPRLLRRSVSSRGRSPRAVGVPRVDMFFPEVDVGPGGRAVGGRENANLPHIRSSEDISSAYIPDSSSSQESLMRTASVGGTTRTRSKVTTRSTFTSIKRPGAAEDNELIIEEMDDEDIPSFMLQNPLPYRQTNDPSELVEGDGTMCLPYSKNILEQYLKAIMQQHIQQASTSDVTDLNYQKYLELKRMFDTGSPILSPKASEKDDGNIKNDNKKINETEKHSTDTITSELPLEVEKMDSDTSVNIPLININCDGKVFIPDEAKKDVEKDESVKNEDKSFLDDSKKISDETRSLGASSSNLSSDDDDEAEGDFTTPNSSPVLRPKANKGGKYKKRHAPPPPSDKPSSQSDRNESDKDSLVNVNTSSDAQDPISPIKATLVLKPGVIKEIGPANTSDKRSEVFVAHSPIKRRHRTKNRSPSRSSKSDSSPISKLMHLPAKFAFWNRNDDESGKSTSRNSLNTYDDSNESSANNDNSSLSDFGSSVDLKSASDDATEKKAISSPAVEDKTLKDSAKESVAPLRNQDSEDDQFQDADDGITEPLTTIAAIVSTSTAQKVKEKIAVKTSEDVLEKPKETTTKDSQNANVSRDYIHVPLKLETLVLFTESKSTDV